MRNVAAETLSNMFKGNCLIDESMFSTLFPKYREQYLKEWWPHVTRLLLKFVSCRVCVTYHSAYCVHAGLGGGQHDGEDDQEDMGPVRHYQGPSLIATHCQARDLIKLLARSVPFQQVLWFYLPLMPVGRKNHGRRCSV